MSVFLTSISAFAFTPEIKTIKLNDGEEITARLCLPDTEVRSIIFCIPGTGQYSGYWKNASSSP